ncbi:MAG: SDR family NAD(P)-dependent oxidoreductase, partial [Actinomycetota bacterium]|nr:SDR family NAD(P)-dependent oxidoreductase [Actinomycetota bacterium]
MEQLEGRVAVVTGAASGIGLAMVEAFLGEGMSVVLSDLDGSGLDTQVARLSA